MHVIHAHVALVEERLAVLEGADHDRAGRRDLEQARRHAGKQAGHAVLPIDVPDHLERVARGLHADDRVRIEEALAELDLAVRFDDVEGGGDEGGQLES